MGTQAVVSFVRGRYDSTEVKVVCGVDGMKAKAFAEHVLKERVFDRRFTLKDIYDRALKCGLGSEACLVVCGGDSVNLGYREYTKSDGELDILYRVTFGNPWFNPRWGLGIADYSLVVDVGSGKIWRWVDPRDVSGQDADDSDESSA